MNLMRCCSVLMIAVHFDVVESKSNPKGALHTTLQFDRWNSTCDQSAFGKYQRALENGSEQNSCNPYNGCGGMDWFDPVVFCERTAITLEIITPGIGTLEAYFAQGNAKEKGVVYKNQYQLETLENYDGIRGSNMVVIIPSKACQDVEKCVLKLQLHSKREHPQQNKSGENSYQACVPYVTSQSCDSDSAYKYSSGITEVSRKLQNDAVGVPVSLTKTQLVDFSTASLLENKEEGEGKEKDKEQDEGKEKENDESGGKEKENDESGGKEKEDDESGGKEKENDESGGKEKEDDESGGKEKEDDEGKDEKRDKDQGSALDVDCSEAGKNYDMGCEIENKDELGCETEKNDDLDCDTDKKQELGCDTAKEDDLECKTEKKDELDCLTDIMDCETQPGNNPTVTGASTSPSPTGSKSNGNSQPLPSPSPTELEDSSGQPQPVPSPSPNHSGSSGQPQPAPYPTTPPGSSGYGPLGEVTAPLTSTGGPVSSSTPSPSLKSTPSDSSKTYGDEPNPKEAGKGSDQPQHAAPSSGKTEETQSGGGASKIPSEELDCNTQNQFDCDTMKPDELGCDTVKPDELGCETAKDLECETTEKATTKLIEKPPSDGKNEKPGEMDVECPGMDIECPDSKSTPSSTPQPDVSPPQTTGSNTAAQHESQGEKRTTKPDVTPPQTTGSILGAQNESQGEKTTTKPDVSPPQTTGSNTAAQHESQGEKTTTKPDVSPPQTTGSNLGAQYESQGGKTYPKSKVADDKNDSSPKPKEPSTSNQATQNEGTSSYDPGRTKSSP